MSQRPPPRASTHAHNMGRSLPALTEGFVWVDGRDIKDDLRLTYTIAKLLHLPISGNDAGERRWSEMLDADEIFLLAEACVHKTSKAYKDSLHITDVNDLANHALAIDELLESWAVRSQSHKGLIQTQGISARTKRFNLLATRWKGATLDNTPLQIFMDHLCKPPVDPAMMTQAPDLEALFLGEALDPNALRFQMISPRARGLNAMAEQAFKELNHALEGPADHPPQVGLLLAFFDLQAVLRARLNRLPDQFLDHYFGRVLGQQIRPASVGTLPLNFRLAPGQAMAFVPAETQVELRRGPGAPLERLRTTEDLEVHDVAVKRLCATLANSGQGDQMARNNVKRLLRRETVVAADGTADFDLHRRTPYRQDVLWKQQDTFMSLSVETETFSHAGAVQTCKITIAGITRSEVAGFENHQLAGSLFSVKLEHEGGTITLPVRNAKIDGSELEIELGSDQSLVLRNDANLGPARLRIFSRFDIMAPTKGGPNAPEALRAWTLRHRVQTVTLLTEYSGLLPTEILAAGESVESAENFALFGLQPKRGATLELRHPFLANGNATAVTLHLDWRDLPTGPFEQYYAGYVGDFTTQAFKITALDHRNKPWLFDAKAQTSQLFQLDGKEKVAIRSAFKIHPPDPAASPVCLKLRLEAPRQGFGAELFPATLASYVADTQTFKERVKRFAGAPDAPPNPPFTPEVSGLRLDLTRTITFGPEGNLQVHYPFGSAKVKAEPTALSDLAVLQPDPSESLVDIVAPFEISVGLSPVAPGKTLRLQAQIEPRTPSVQRTKTYQKSQEPSWFYLSAKGWKPILPQSGLVDTTAGLGRSGSVALRIPEDASPEGPGMPEGLVWLSARWHTVQVPELGRLRSLTCNTVEAAVIEGAATPAEQLSNPKDWTLRIIDMDTASKVSVVRATGGWLGQRPNEDQATYRARVSERLGHRNRAILASDYEGLVLSEFPEISDARVVQRGAGQVTVVVVPKRERGEPPPPASPSQLDQIWEMLAARCAVDPNQLTVRGAEFETLQAVGHIELAQGSSPQTWLDLSDRVSHWLAPWIKDPTLPVPIGGHIDLGALHGRLVNQPQVGSVNWLGVSRTSDAILDPSNVAPNLLYLQKLSVAPGKPQIVQSSCAWSMMLPVAHHTLNHSPDPNSSWPGRQSISTISELFPGRDTGIRPFHEGVFPKSEEETAKDTKKDE